VTAPIEIEVGRVIGAPVARKEDRKLLEGQAQWVDNFRAPGMVYLHVVRSPYAHARIVDVDVSAALAHADVVGAWSGADLVDEWHGSLPCAWIPTEDTNAPEHKPLAIDKVRYAGDAVAVVAARSRGGASIRRLRWPRVRRWCTSSSARTAATHGSWRRARWRGCSRTRR